MNIGPPPKPHGTRDNLHRQGMEELHIRDAHLEVGLLGHGSVQRLVGTDNPGSVNWVAVVRRSGEHGGVMKQHRADIFMGLDADPREGGTSFGDERATLLRIPALPAPNAAGQV
jgi:hypothetical protein